MGSQITNGFGGGTGTEQDPYLIYNEEQFSHIKTLVPAMANDPEGFFYFSVMNDLEFTDDMDSPAIGIFRGNIDFNNHSLSGLSFALINNKLSDLQRKYMVYNAAYGLIDNFLEGTISNLEYRPDGLVMFAFMTHHYNSVLYNNGVQNSTQTVTFRNVDAYGDFNEPNNNNTSCYVSQVFQGYTIFEDCTNYASQTTAYGGAFVGGYPWGQFDDGSYSYVTFENCVNYGDITGERAAVFIGSHNTISRLSNVTKPIIKVTNCANYGTIQGSYGVGYYFPVANGKANPADYKWFDMSTDSTNTGNDAEHIILLANPTNVTVKTNEDEAFSISNNNTSYSSFMIQGSTYSTTTNPEGTIRIYVSQEDIACTSGSTVTSAIRKLQIIDSMNQSIDSIALNTVRTDAYGNQLITVGNVDYYYNDSSTIGGVVGGSALVADLTWTLTCYDADGFIVGQMDIE